METGELFCYSLGSVVDPSTSSVIKYQYKYIPVPVPSTTRLPTNDYVPTRTLRSSNTNLLTAAPPLASPAMGHRGMCPPLSTSNWLIFGDHSLHSLSMTHAVSCAVEHFVAISTRSHFSHVHIHAYRCHRLLPCDAVCTVSVIVILSVRPSVCPSVCHTRGLCPHGSTYDQDFFTAG